MIRIASIVTGHGEVTAAPLLLRRIAQDLDPGLILDLPSPLRLSEGKLHKQDELARTVELAARRAGPHGGVFLLTDCDDGCPAQDGPALLARVRAVRSDRPLAVALAHREFESWFLAAAESLRGRVGLDAQLSPPDQPEALRDAKGWLKRHMQGARGYNEVLDQPKLAAAFDLAQARGRSDSFDVCYRRVAELLSALRPPPEAAPS